jgi:hypothetical protein
MAAMQILRPVAVAVVLADLVQTLLQVLPVPVVLECSHQCLVQLLHTAVVAVVESALLPVAQVPQVAAVAQEERMRQVRPVQ